MSHPVLQLVSAADAKFYPGLLVSLGSALACASGDFDYSITVIDGGISAADWAAIDSYLRRIGREKQIEVRLSRIDATGALVSGMPSRRGSVLTFARLAIPSIMNVPKVIYIDSDVVCLRGVEEFWTGLDTGATLVAARDPLDTLGRDPLTRQLPKSKHKLPYFNAGIIGMNLERWMDPEIASQINSLLPQAKSFRYVDQSLLNLVFHDQWFEVPGACNRLLTLAACSLLANATEPANYHYIGPCKPWLTTASNFYRTCPICFSTVCINGFAMADPARPEPFAPSRWRPPVEKAFSIVISFPRAAANTPTLSRSRETPARSLTDCSKSAKSPRLRSARVSPQQP